MSALRRSEVGADADRRLASFLRMHRLWCETAAEAGRRLLRVLFIRLGAMSPYSGRAFGPSRRSLLLCQVIRQEQSCDPTFKGLARQHPRQCVGVVA